PMCRGAMTRPKPATWDADIAGQGRQTCDGPSGLPAVGTLVHRAPAQHDHGWPGCGIAPRQCYDTLRGDTGDALGPRRSVRLHVGGQRLEAHGVVCYKLPVV